MKKILVVDDEFPIRSLLETTLKLQGYEVFLAANGHEGLDSFRAHDPQLIITDLRMPLMNGVEFLQNLRLGQDDNKATIVLTGRGSDEDVEACFKLGIQTFLRKPVNIFELEGLVKKSFEIMDAASLLRQEIKEKEKANNRADDLNHLLKSTVDNLAEGVVILDEHFMIRMASAGACQLLGLNNESEAVHKPAAVVLGAPLAGPSGVLLEVAQRGLDVRNQSSSLYCLSGAIVPIYLNIIALTYAKGRKGWLLTMRDRRADERRLLQDADMAAFGNMIGRDPSIIAVFNCIDKVASAHANILIQGESGTGKELAALEIHARGSRAQKPFHAVNCAAISADLLESEFFGHEKGAFTGAVATKQGRFELAQGGTLFLDEVSEIPVQLQSKLLRALQERNFERVGGTRTIHVDVRVIAATNQDLEMMVAQKKFREDLYYRLNVIPIHLPPLRERPRDIPLLVDYFIKELNVLEGRGVISLAPEALKHLMSQVWPGNIRQLHNAVEHAFALSSGAILEEHHFPTVSPQEKIEVARPESEKELTLLALRRANFNKSKAAALLGINRSSLYRREKKYKLLADNDV